MFLGVSSPVVDLFLQGDVPRDVRLLAARGLTDEDGLTRLALLAWLTADADEDVARAAAQTLEVLPVEPLRAALARATTPAPLRAWYEARLSMGRVEVPAVDVDPSGAATVDADPVDPETVAPDTLDDEQEAAPSEPESADDASSDDAHQLLTSLPVPEKLKLATLGRREQRAVLIRDPNRLVAAAVMASPKLTDTEVENFSRMQNVSDEVLRLIGTSRQWTKNYSVVAALVKNPRTPTSVSLPMVLRLAERDIKALSVDRNVPESVRLAARKQLAVMQSRRE